jgi:hypothetical protein
MYSSEYTSGFSRPCAAHLVAPPSPRHEGNVGQAPSKLRKNYIARKTDGTRGLIWSIWSIWFIWLVSFNQKDQIDQINKTDWRQSPQ